MQKIFIAFYVFLFLIYSCANIVTPSGGPKDSVPPKVLKTYPENNSINFWDNKISIYFDEFFELNLPQKNILISPFSKQELSYSIVGKKLTIKFSEGLKPNTTYSIQLNNAVKDYNEANLLGNFALNFSTGQYLDSGKLTIGTNNIYANPSGENVLVCLVKNKSDFFGNNYHYISKSNGGVSQFSNLNKTKYFVYAFVDSNQNMQWEKTEAIAFGNEEVSQADKIKTLILFNTRLPKNSFFVSPKAINEYELSTSEEIFFPQLLDTNNLLIKTGDKSYTIITADSRFSQTTILKYNQDKFESIVLAKNDKPKYIELIKLQESRMDVYKRNDTVELPFNSFISGFNNEKIRLLSEKDTIVPHVFVSQNKLYLTGLDFEKTYSLVLDSQAIFYYNSYNKPISYQFNTYKNSDYYPELIFKLDSGISKWKNPKLIYNNQEIKNIDKIYISNFYGSKIELILIDDENNNGYWDTGDVEKGIQPEKIQKIDQVLDAKTKEYTLKLN